MCYIEASCYIHCMHLNIHFWTCTDVDHGHLRPKSVMHSYHRLCPVCFMEKYVRADGEAEALEGTQEDAKAVGVDEDESENGLEELLPVDRDGVWRKVQPIAM
jgi:hypothetical protein